MRKIQTKYSQTFLYIILLACILCLMLFARRCDSGLHLPQLMTGGSKGDTIDVGLIYGPMSYYIYDDTLGGMNYELILRMEKEIGRPVKLWPVSTLRDALDRLENGNFNIVASLPSDNSVKQRFLTTRSVFLDCMTLVQRRDSKGNVKVKSNLDLGADTVYIQKDSPAASRLNNLSNEIDIDIPLKEVDLSEEYLCMKVASGEFPLTVVNRRLAEKMSAIYPELAIDNPVSFTQFQVWLLNPADSLLRDRVDAWIDSTITTPGYRTLLKRYSTPLSGN